MSEITFLKVQSVCPEKKLIKLFVTATGLIPPNSKCELQIITEAGTQWYKIGSIICEGERVTSKLYDLILIKFENELLKLYDDIIQAELTRRTIISKANKVIIQKLEG